MASSLLGGAASSTATVAVSGSVRNGTPGGAVPENLEVTVVQLSSQSEIGRKTAATSGGRFRVEGFDDVGQQSFVVGADYSGVTYSTVAEGAGPEVAAELTIYETTPDESAISMMSDILTIVQGESDTLEVIQLFRLRNSADRAFTGTEASSEGPRATLSLPVPSAAFDFLPLEGITASAMSQSGRGIFTGDPILPGESKVSYMFKVRIGRSGWSFERPVFYPTERTSVLVGEGLRLESDEFQLEKNVTLAQKEYKQYRGPAKAAGSFLTGTIGSGDSSSNALAAGLAAGAVLTIVGALIYRSRRRAVPFTQTSSETFASSAADRERLIERIAELDEAFESGGVPEEEYRQRRAAMRREIESLTASIRS